MVYKSLVFSKYNYAIELYGDTTNNLINKIQLLQNKLLKLLFLRNRLYATNLLHKETNTLKIKDNYELRLLLHIHKFHKNIKIVYIIEKIYIIIALDIQKISTYQLKTCVNEELLILLLQYYGTNSIKNLKI